MRELRYQRVPSRGGHGRMLRVGQAGLAVVASLSMSRATAAQPGLSGDVERPTYRQQRSEEDWSVLRDHSRHREWWDRLKFIPLRSDPDWFVTLGGEFRPFYELYDHYNWGTGPEDDTGFYL